MLPYKENQVAVHEFNVLAVEAGILTNLASTFKKIFPTIAQLFAGGFSKTAEITHAHNHFSASPFEKKAREKLETALYTNLADMEVMKPEGLKSDFLSFALDLHETLKYYANTRARALDPFHADLVSFLSFPDSRKSTKDNADAAKKMYDTRQTYVNAVNHHFEDSSHVSMGKYETLVKRNADLISLIEVVRQTEHIVSAIDFKSLNEQCRKSLAVIEEIAKEAERGSISTVSPQSAQNLALLTAEVARELEFLSAMYFLFLQLQTCLNNLLEQIVKR
jgi:hypothetical protein